MNEAETDAFLVISAMAEINKHHLALLVPHCSNMAKKVQVSVCVNIQFDKIAIILFKKYFIKIMERETISTWRGVEIFYDMYMYIYRLRCNYYLKNSFPTWWQLEDSKCSTTFDRNCCTSFLCIPFKILKTSSDGTEELLESMSFASQEMLTEKKIINVHWFEYNVFSRIQGSFTRNRFTLHSICPHTLFA